MTALLFTLLTYLGVACYFGCAAALYRLARRIGGDASRALRTLAFILAMWGVAYVPACFSPSHPLAEEMYPMSVFTLVGGNLYVILTLLYPLEATRPGWLGVRSVGRLMLPFIAVTALYFIVLGLTGQPVRRLDDQADIWLHIGEFNVWYRFVLYLSVCLYIVYALLSTSTPHRRKHPHRTGAAGSAVGAGITAGPGREAMGRVHASTPHAMRAADCPVSRERTIGAGGTPDACGAGNPIGTGAPTHTGASATSAGPNSRNNSGRSLDPNSLSGPAAPSNSASGPAGRGKWSDICGPNGEDTCWLRIYNLGVGCITIAYLGVLLFGSVESLIIHRCITLLFFLTIVRLTFVRYSRSTTPGPKP